MSKQWACSSCTYANHPDLPTCEMCHTPRSAASKKGKTQAADLYGNYESHSDVIANTVAKAAGKTTNPFDPNYQQLPSQMRTPTVQQGGDLSSVARPMTSVKGAGYSSANNSGRQGSFDPLKQKKNQGPAPPLVSRSENSAEFQARDMEAEVNRLLEKSAEANANNSYPEALERAKEAGKRERSLCQHREKHNMQDAISYDLTYAVLFNLAIQYHANKMYAEAINHYSLIVKNKQYPNGGRLRVNMGNIYYEQKKYPSAIKMYRMAIDIMGQPNREMRFKIMRNIGNAFVRLGQFPDAIQNYEAVMEAHGDPQTGFNLILCYYALGDRDKMKKGFLQLLSVPEYIDDENEAAEDEFNEKLTQQDELMMDRRERRKVTHRYVRMAARLIAPKIDKDLSAGFDLIIEYLRTPRPNSPLGGTALSGSRQGFPAIAMEMEIAKGIAFLKLKNYKAAIDVFKSFEKKDEGLIDQAATNLSFVYFLEGDLKNAEKYAELAVKADRYNAKALVNRANYIYARGDIESARELYLEAIGVEADCVEAIYNLGLANKKLDHLEDALQAFRKLHRIIPKDPQVIYHIANLYDMLENNIEAEKYFKILHGAVPSDPKVLARLGTLYNKEEDETQAFHNFTDSYNCYPVNMEVISWLGVWYVRTELYEEAIQYFQRAAEIEPNEVKWQLMVASCYRRLRNMHAALELYKKIHRQDPDNIECLKYLCTCCKDMNDQDYDEYNKLLKKAERRLQAEENRYMKEESKHQDTYEPGEGHLNEEDMKAGGYSGLNAQMNAEFNAKVEEKTQDGQTISAKQDDDDWGDDDLGEDLLPI